MEFSIEEFSSPSKSFKHNYKKLSLIGNGSFGKVYKAKEINTNNIVAVKQISINNEYTLKEINVLSNLSHQNIVKYYNYYEDKDKIYIIMEYLEGGTLKDFIEKEKNKITEDTCRIIIKQILSALSHLHYVCDICHRDIKPENIMFKFKDNIKSLKLIDFGLSSNSFEKKNYLENCGTLAYMAPEQISNKIYSKSVDIWSVGIILYMLLNNGKNPFYIKGDSREEVIKKISSKKVEYDDINNPISQIGKDFINKLLMKNSSSRYTARPALNHPWLTMQKFEKIPMTVLDKLLIGAHINRLKELFLTALFMNFYKKNNINTFIKNTSYENTIEELEIKKRDSSRSEIKQSKLNMNFEINKNNFKVFDLEEYFQRVKKSNLLLEKKFKEKREIMFITKKNTIENKIKNININEEKKKNDINNINNLNVKQIDENKKNERNKKFVIGKFNKNNTIYNFQSSPIKLKKILRSINNNNNKKKINNNFINNIDSTILKKKILLMKNKDNYKYRDNRKDNDNFTKNELITLHEFLNKEKTIKRFNQYNGLFITDNHQVNNLNDKKNFTYIKHYSNKLLNYKSSLRQTINDNSFLLNQFQNNLFNNYSKNKIYIHNKHKNKSVDNLDNFIFKNINLGNKLNSERKNNNNTKYNFFYQTKSINKNISCSFIKKKDTNEIIDDYFPNVYYEIKPKRLLFNIKRKILPRIINRK